MEFCHSHHLTILCYICLYDVTLEVADERQCGEQVGGGVVEVDGVVDEGCQILDYFVGDGLGIVLFGPLLNHGLPDLVGALG